MDEVAKKPDDSTFTSDGRHKAKARFALLGFEHPDLLSDHYQTASPVQAVLTRNLSYQLVLQEGWEIEGLDLSTAFLQTLPTEESKKLWTTGVQELREAFGLPPNGILHILKDFYGSSTAPRNLWKNIDGSLKALGAVRPVGDPCFWIWRVPLTPQDQKLLDPQNPLHDKIKYKTLGFMAGHVDDFHRAGDLSDQRWLQISSKIDAMYKWGQLKKNEYRHAGTDLTLTQDPVFGRCLTIDQSYYIEMLEDVQIDPQRFSMTQATMSDKEISPCRGAIGALQWVAVQTQPLACARCNLLLAGQPTMRVAQEIQELIKELRKSSTVLKFFRIPKENHWGQMVIVGLGDQTHQNRPKGGSTGGLPIFLSNQDCSTWPTSSYGSCDMEDLEVWSESPLAPTTQRCNPWWRQTTFCFALACFGRQSIQLALLILAKELIFFMPQKKKRSSFSDCLAQIRRVVMTPLWWMRARFLVCQTLALPFKPSSWKRPFHDVWLDSYGWPVTGISPIAWQRRRKNAGNPWNSFWNAVFGCWNSIQALYSLLGKNVQQRAHQSSSCKDYRPRTHKKIGVMQFIRVVTPMCSWLSSGLFLSLGPANSLRYAMEMGRLWPRCEVAFSKPWRTICVVYYQYIILFLEHPTSDFQSQSQFRSCYLNKPSKCWHLFWGIWFFFFHSILSTVSHRADRQWRESL